MSDKFIPFDAMRDQVSKLLTASCTSLAAVERVYLVRDLLGRVRISVPDVIEADESCREALQHFAKDLRIALGPHGYPAEVGVLFVDTAMLDHLKSAATRVRHNVYWVDRMVTGGDWWTVGESRPGAERAPAIRSIRSKGGVGRSTTAAVLSWHLARKGERVLVVDLDLESPGLSSAMLDAHRPRFGVVDWFVEDLVAQADHVIEEMTAYPAWGLDFDGEVHVVPAHGGRTGRVSGEVGPCLPGYRHPLDGPPRTLAVAARRDLRAVDRPHGERQWLARHRGGDGHRHRRSSPPVSP